MECLPFVNLLMIRRHKDQMRNEAYWLQYAIARIDFMEKD